MRSLVFKSLQLKARYYMIIVLKVILDSNAIACNRADNNLELRLFPCFVN